MSADNAWPSEMIEAAAGPCGGDRESSTTIGLEVLLRNGLWIRKRFSLPIAPLESCIIHGHRQYYAVEITHKCEGRTLLYEELARIVPTQFHGENIHWFRTLNKEANTSTACLFEGAKLEVNLSSTFVPEFGLCFPRSAFVAERDALNLERLFAPDQDDQDWVDWRRRRPSDADRLRVNRDGWEVLYFLRAPPTEFDITISDIRSELCHTLGIQDPKRIKLAAGVFYWESDFKDDGVGLYNTYFGTDHVIDGRHMKTVHGSALIDVFEV